MTGAEHEPPAGLAQWQRTLLPAALLEESGGRRTPRDWVVDALMYICSIGFGVAILGTTISARSQAMVVLDVAGGVVAFAALWFRRRHPMPVAIAVIALSSFSALAAAAALAGCFNAALRMPPRPLAGVAALAFAGVAVSAAFYGNEHGYDWIGLLVGVLLTVIVLGWGLFARAQRDLVKSLHERAQRLHAERRLHAEQARDAERRRIAREMHDVLAHRISLLSVHAGALEFRPDAPPDEIAQAAGVVRAAAHAALQELRDVIGVLRDDGEPAGVVGASRATEPPQPTLGAIPALVEESREAGTRVRLRIEAPASDAMPVALGRTAYRIVQEGLTNARKHAPAAAVDVDIAGGDGDGTLVVSVVSRRPVGVAAATSAVNARDRPPGAGTGLIGLGERVALAGGALQHGPDAAGDFVLRATLPWPA
ncbi:MAG TPA: histidine kinase [Baekduia sp.]|jgi:signal transduction histidine kinase|nr:histidine kinase [Baekduia sp.]